MLRSLMILLVVINGLMLGACSPQSEKGYAANPKAIQKALAQCPEQPPGKNLTCTQLQEVAARINQLAYKLQVNQQAYGKDILVLQEKITEQRGDLDKHPEQLALRQSLIQNEQDLQEHLAVVRWLASPDR